MSSEGGRPGPIVVAHRGASAYEPENTLRAVHRAIDMGAPAVEVDVRRTKDGALVLMHDETVDRTTDGHGRVAELTVAEIRKLDAGRGERVPTLPEVCREVEGHAQLVVELKTRGLAGPAANVLRSRIPRPAIVVVSFHASEVEGVKRARPALRAGVLFLGAPADGLALAKALRSDVAGFQQETVTRDLIAQAHRAGLGLLTWTVNEPDRARILAHAGVDYLATDVPDVILEALRA